MAAPHDHLELAAGFAAASEDEWRELVAGVLQKSGRNEADPIAALSTTTYDGIEVRPLYTDAPDQVRDVVVRSAWDVRARLCDTDAQRTNDAALAELEGGATSLWVVAGAAGLDPSDLPAALDGVLLDVAPIALDAGEATVDAARELLALGDDVHGGLGADPIGLFAETGAPPDLTVLAALAAHARPDLRLATIDATVYHDAGASDADEVGVATAVGVAYLRALADAGLDTRAAFDALEFRFAVTADQFASVAKLRAARRVWARVAELCGADVRPQRQHAVTSAAMLTRRDPWVNLVRSTVACFAAATGGADAITVLPFDTAVGRPDAFARRIARNTSVILHDESSLGRVSDAAGGSWFVETFTAELAERAWDAFTAIERAGGAVDGFDIISKRIDATRSARTGDVADRRAPIVGVSAYALPDEPALERDEAPPSRSGGPLTAARWAAPFETLRDEVEQEAPAVFLATLGPLAEHAARADFARDVFNAGGFRVVAGPVEEFAASGASIACVCGTDDAYAADGSATVTALRDAGARRVLLAGRTELDGVDATVYRGCDVLDMLTDTWTAAR